MDGEPDVESDSEPDVERGIESDSEPDVEAGELAFVEWYSSSLRSSRSSFESTNDEKPTSRTRTRKSKSKRRPSNPENNEEWDDYIHEESKHLIRKCRTRSKKTSWYSALFTYMNDITNMYIILFALATFIISSIKTKYDTGDYVLIGLSAVAAAVESLQTLFKYKKRSIYFKQASLQYKRIYRKLVKYSYTENLSKMAGYLSLAYQDVDKLDLNDHQANFNKFNKSYKSHAAALTKKQGEELYS